ncbi:hypothetical protein BU24DRAFT_467143 [Aaosphaeria arxii CBS 175.79]|uniref:Protein kinase domain-containing protein n=1 Tax=Aaosphaeria arxii CBS 175.79 TaxID=1450172 RepID=A0A6A5XC74_9PLEO|nr:uncharacterized protein BU24DRAFT_467143 [Aaosphaeria arxii CBS 175.79]KAF2010520.1 hypothetical protein BU24DRAFT_467143 [Aaosphaeria arxii CBS 175.79]
MTEQDSPMTTNSLESAFSRLPRPQRVLDLSRPNVPTKSALFQKQKSIHVASNNKRHVDEDCEPILATKVTRGASVASIKPLDTKTRCPIEGDAMQTLGKFTQHSVEWTVCVLKSLSTVVMVKEVSRTAGLREKSILERLEHRNVARLMFSDLHEQKMRLGIEYCRFTLLEVLYVNLKPGEQQIHYIACSMFDALIYLARHKISHRSINLSSIRLTVPDLRLVLSEFTSAAILDTSFESHKDLNDLALVLLECMEGRPLLSEKRSTDFVKGQRAQNKVFGLSDPERWTGCKVLVDFLDELFSEERSASTKLSKPVGIQTAS